MRCAGYLLPLLLLAAAVGGGEQGAIDTSFDHWLARQQHDSGAWTVDGEPHVGATALSLLAYLGAGYTDRGTVKENRYVAHVRRALRFLRARQDDTGRFHATDPRQHALAALAMSEAYWMTRNPFYKRPAQRGVDALERFDAGDDAIGHALAVAALKSAGFAELAVPVERLERERRWLDAHTDPETGRSTAAGRVACNTAAGMVSRIFLGEDPRESEAIGKAAKFLLLHVPDADPAARDPWGWWFATLGLFQVGRAPWRQWNAAMKSAVVGTQHPRGSGDLTGSWDPGPLAAECYGRVGATALLTGCLEVYYRYDKVFGAAGDGRSGRDRSRARTWRRSPLVPHTSRIRLEDDRVLPLETMAADVVIDGFRARVRLTLYFFHDGEDREEGTFQLRLPDGASPHTLAFGGMVQKASDAAAAVAGRSARELGAREHWPNTKQARMVARETARQAYTTITTEKRDPALLEWGGNGVFHARIFPIEPNKLHQVVLAYDVDLVADGAALRFEMALPETSRPNDVTFRFAAEPRTMEPRLARDFPRTGVRRFAVTFDAPAAAVLTGDDPATGAYAAVRAVPDLPREEGACARRAVFLLDVSGSSREHYADYLALARGILQGNREALRSFRFVFFDTRVSAGGWLRNPDGIPEALAEAGRREPAGATDLAAALRLVAEDDADLFLLSDARASWGPVRLPDTLRGRLFAYRFGPEADVFAAVERLAAATGGAVFRADGPATYRAHRAKAWRIEELSLPGCRDLLVAGGARALHPGAVLTVAGRGRPAPGAALRVRLRCGDETRTWRAPLPAPVASPLAPRVYGEIAVGALEPFVLAERSVPEAYARHFRVVRETCSLLMLETEADYARFGIKPADDAGVVRSVFASVWLKDRARPSFRDELRRRLERLDGRGFRAEAPLELLAHVGDSDFDVASAGMDAADTAGVEEHPADALVLAKAGRVALHRGRPQDAYHLFARAVRVAPGRPWLYHDLAQACEQLDRLRLGLLYCAVFDAFETRRRDGRASGVAERLCVRALEQPEDAFWTGYAKRRLADIRYGGAADLVVVLQWDTDGTDVDLHVVDPFGDVCNWRRRASAAGGRLAEDRFDGYGPEVYRLEEAEPGTYVVRVNYFRPDAERARPVTRAFVTIIRDAGRPTERTERKQVELELRDQMVEVARVTVPPSD